MEAQVAKQVLRTLGFDDIDKGAASFIRNSAKHTTVIYENENCSWRFSFVDYGALQGPKRTIQRFYCVCYLEDSEDAAGFIGHYNVWEGYPLLSLYEIDVDVAKHMILAGQGI